jgi:type III restriction enzyme
MQFTLKEYQSEAVRQILSALGRSRKDWHQYEDRSAFALSATTGSGKTVIAAAVIEALLHGSDEFEVEADPSAVFLWVSKDPALNEQTRGRFIECADRIPPGDLVLLDKTYADESLETGTVYFINPQKLSKTADFVKHTDERKVTFWEILGNTIRDKSKTFYMVLDEAHEGMKEPSDTEQTIVQKIIRGNGANPAMPVVWGISATVQRFNEAMEKADQFTKRPNVLIDPKDVQASGLLKNSLALDIPDEDGNFETAMVRDATLDFVDVCERWDRYCEAEQIEDPVVPLLVIQIPNKTEGAKDSEKGLQEEDATIHRVLETVRKHWSEMPEDCVAHVLGDRATIEVGAYTIPKIAAQDIEHTHEVRVLVAKDAVSTGWDCPRAEVLVSLRPGNEPTYVTQLLGRMVRTPLAQQTSEDRLNSASCYLPLFKRDTAKRVAEEIMGMRKPEKGKASGAAISKVLLKPVMIGWNPEVAEDVRPVIEGLPSYAKPTAVPRPIKRLLKAAQAFAQDIAPDQDKALVPDADKTAHETLFAVLDGIMERDADAIEAEAKRILTAEVRRILAERGKEKSTEETTQRHADAATVDDALRHLRRQITTSVVNRYLSRDMQKAINEAIERGEDPSAVDITSIRARVAALGTVALPEDETPVKDAVDDAADTLTRLWLTTHTTAIKRLPDRRQPTYDDIRAMARQPEATSIEIKAEEKVDTVDTDWNPLAKARMHVLADPDGDFPLDLKLNRWERAVIAQEAEDSAGWYRNPSTAGKNSLRIAYEDGDIWKSVQPDLIFVNRINVELRPSIVDPHGAHLGDASPKLKALAQYADEHGDLFDRIIAIGVEKAGALYGINMLDSKVRKSVYESAADTESLKAVFAKHGTKYADLPTSV